MTKQKILLLTLEFPHWSDAAKYSYEANFGLEEGLLAQGVDCLTIPMMFGNGDLSWARWFDVIRARLQGKSFDQVWFEVTHSAIPAPFLEFIDSLAPVRLGFVCESIEDTPQCIAWNPGGAQMRSDNLARNLKHTTHLVVVDEADFVRFNREGKTPAFWWAGMHVPGRVIASAPQPATTAPAEFYGTPYGERAQWLTHPELAGLLTSGISLESGTPYPAQWNRLSQKLHTALGAGKEIREEMFYSYINLVRNARRETYPLWLKSLTSGAAVVSLPSFILAYTGRVAQGMAAGRPVVCCEIPDRPRTSKLFENGKEILLYSCDHPAELAEHIRHIQRDPAFGQKIARNALGKMRRFHTVEKFVANILTWIENGAEPDYGDNIGARATPAPAWIARSAIPVVAAVIADQAVPAKGTDLTQLLERKLAREGQPLRLHLGCGEQYFTGYVNIDYPGDQHNVMQVKADYQANITQLDFPPQSVDEIRLHHVFEHFNRVTALAMLIKWQQWLKVGGKLHIETPDLMGSAEILVSNHSWLVKMGTVRHLAGDQAASWAYHVDHWFPERFQHTLKLLGFGRVETQSSRWPQPPHLCNVQAVGIKTEIFTPDQLQATADGLLWESTVAPVEKPTHTVWTRQLRAVLQNIPCGPGNIHVADAGRETTTPVAAPAPVAMMAKAPAQPGLPASAVGLMPLTEIHDFNQRNRDCWVRAKAATVAEGSRVLDMGAGTCLYRPLFSHCDYKTHDFKKYEGAEKHGGTSAYGHIDYVSEILAIPAPDQSFDVILCTEVLEHVPEPIQVLKEISRLLRPGGRAFITAPLGSGLHQLPFHFYGGYTPEWYKRFCTEAGMEAIEITPNGGFFKHLGQECSRAASIYGQNPKLHGPESADLIKLLVEILPRLFFDLDDKCFDERFTVGYFVEAVKMGNSIRAIH
jgi:predicted SAM-dependent methyltransferase